MRLFFSEGRGEFGDRNREGKGRVAGGVIEIGWFEGDGGVEGGVMV